MKRPAFKEWHVVCEALGRSVQDVIIRKGGIHEGRDGFRFEYDEFYLFPTLFHRQAELVKPQAGQWLGDTDKRVYKEGEPLEIHYRCRVSSVELCQDWDAVCALDHRHIYSEDLLRERFFWQGKGMKSGSVSIAHVVIEVLDKPLVIQYTKSLYGGCRSWVAL